jgi:uncharacterized protein (TIGR00255 family)
MIKSMTGYGRFELERDTRRYTVELKGVNHRYLDLNIRLPRSFNFYEAAIRSQLKNQISRGKVDIYISFEDCSENQLSLKFNSALAEEYLKIFGKMEEDYNLFNDVRVSHLSRYPEVLTMEEQEVDQEELLIGLQEAVQEAIDRFVDTKILEGKNLEENLKSKLDVMEEAIVFIEERSPEIIKGYREKIELKVQELLGNFKLEDERILAEVVLFADKICTDEEVVRLRSHISHMREAFSDKEGVGRKLDFIAQEMNREANTILSKANDMDISNHAITLKSEIEKIREQIQNIE